MQEDNKTQSDTVALHLKSQSKHVTLLYALHIDEPLKS